MKSAFSLSSVSPTRLTVTFAAGAAVWLLAPELAHAAVAFGEIGQNIAQNAKGVAKGITLGGFATGGAWVFGVVWICTSLHTVHYLPN